MLSSSAPLRCALVLRRANITAAEEAKGIASLQDSVGTMEVL